MPTSCRRHPSACPAQHILLNACVPTTLPEELASPKPCSAIATSRSGRHDDTGRDGGKSSRRVGGVDGLPAGPAGPVDVDAHIEENVVDLATAARTAAELQVEIDLLADLVALARRVRDSRSDRKWEKLRELPSRHRLPPGRHQRRRPPRAQHQPLPPFSRSARPTSARAGGQAAHSTRGGCAGSRSTTSASTERPTAAT